MCQLELNFFNFFYTPVCTNISTPNHNFLFFFSPSFLNPSHYSLPFPPPLAPFIPLPLLLRFTNTSHRRRFSSPQAHSAPVDLCRTTDLFSPSLMSHPSQAPREPHTSVFMHQPPLLLSHSLPSYSSQTPHEPLEICSSFVPTIVFLLAPTANKSSPLIRKSVSFPLRRNEHLNPPFYPSRS